MPLQAEGPGLAILQDGFCLIISVLFIGAAKHLGDE
jgi:hypothetical protein